MMLAGVKERTREIGLRKAVGANRAAIRRQFLTESALLAQGGAAAGILFGLLLGNLAALYLDGPFSIPWKWLGISVLLCLGIGLLAGSLPARRAAALQPVEALHCE